MSNGTLDIPTAEVFEPLLYSARYKGAWGGRGSAKSHFFGGLAVQRAKQKPGTRIVCIREIQRSLDQSVKALIEYKIKTFGLESSFRIMHTHIETPGDGVIIFNGMQNHTAETIKSLEGFDIAWVEEAQSLSERSLTLLRPTIRREDSELWFSWNPRHKTDPVDVLLRGEQTPPGTVVVKANYRDNPWFPEVLRREMEWDRSVDLDKYKHVWLGGYEEHSEARVFKNWRVEEFDEHVGIVPRWGGDWGFSVDPAVLLRLYERRKPGEGEVWPCRPGTKEPRKRLYITHEAYQVGCEIDNLPALFRKVPGAEGGRIIADSQRPDTISYMKRHGFPRMEAAIKGPNSILEGILFLQGYDIIIHPRCVRTIDEFTYFSYKRDPITDEVTNQLEEKKNHVIDSARYAVESLRVGQRSQHPAVWG